MCEGESGECVRGREVSVRGGGTWKGFYSLIYVYESFYTFLSVLLPHNVVLYAAYQADPFQR